tara:strand:- start:344 stop:526 length:183 start_codon:yes stop_codon:yes gene_type:complete
MTSAEVTNGMGKHMEEMERLLIKYEAIESAMLVMDDYDGGQMHMVQLIVKDLRDLMWWRM